MDNMKNVSRASYYGSGSSMITDFVSEYSNVYSFSNEGFRFVQDHDGIADLEYNLVENFNWHNSGLALKRYKRLVDFYTGNIFGKNNFLTDFKYKGWWQYDLIDRGNLYYFRKRILNIKATIWRNQSERAMNIMKNEITYCSHPSEKKFLELTQNYIDELFTSVVDDRKSICWWWIR